MSSRLDLVFKIDRSAMRFHAFWLMAAAILVIALVPGDGIAPFVSGAANHILAFVTLSIFALCLWPGLNPLIHWVGLSAFGGAIELLQATMSLGRQAEWADWINDSLTAALVLALFSIVRAVERRASPDLDEGAHHVASGSTLCPAADEIVIDRGEPEHFAVGLSALGSERLDGLVKVVEHFPGRMVGDERLQPEKA